MVISNLQREIEKQMAHRFTRKRRSEFQYDYEVYHSLEEVSVTVLCSFLQQFPNLQMTLFITDSRLDVWDEQESPWAGYYVFCWKVIRRKTTLCASGKNNHINVKEKSSFKHYRFFTMISLLSARKEKPSSKEIRVDWLWRSCQGVDWTCFLPVVCQRGTSICLQTWSIF